MYNRAELVKLQRQLEEVRRTRPDVYDLIRNAVTLPADKYDKFMRQAMPILRKYMN